MGAQGRRPPCRPRLGRSMRQTLVLSSHWPFQSAQDPSPGIELLTPTFEVDFPTPVNWIQKLPHELVQKFNLLDRSRPYQGDSINHN